MVKIVNRNNKSIVYGTASKATIGDLLEVDNPSHKYVVVTQSFRSGDNAVAFVTPISDYTNPSLNMLTDIFEHLTLEKVS